MARPANNDPLDKFRWAVSIQSDGQESFIRLGFTKVDVPSVKITTKSYAEGGSHLFPKKIIESVEYPPIVLERGVTDNLDFHNWATQYIDLWTGVRSDGAKDFSRLEKFNNEKRKHLEGMNKSSIWNNPPDFPEKATEDDLEESIKTPSDIVADGTPEGPNDYRRDIVINHVNREGEVVKTYYIYKAFPIEYKPASEFNSAGDDGYSMERIVLAYESFTVVPSKKDTNPFDVKDVFKRAVRNAF